MPGCWVQRRIEAASRARSRLWLPGTQVWAKLRGSAAWPGAIWSYDLCQRKDAPQLLTSFVEGTFCYMLPQSSLLIPNRIDILDSDLRWGTAVGMPKTIAQGDVHALPHLSAATQQPQHNIWNR